MDLNVIEQLITFITLPFQSFLTIEILLIFLLILIFLIYNEKRQNKKVKYALIALIIFLFSILAFYFSEDIVTVLSEIIKTLINIYTCTNLKSDGIYFIIAVKNQENKIEGFLRSILFKMIYGKEENVKHIIVTDLDSSDDTRKYFAKAK